ncbi:MAG TPA: tetratricopeptide repeat protein [Lentimicrobium sp.]|nr:tetratricopeptide repeat protein [Lentimicrobium sp.]
MHLNKTEFRHLLHRWNFVTLLVLAVVLLIRNVSAQDAGSLRISDSIRIATLENRFENFLYEKQADSARAAADSLIAFALRTENYRYVAVGYLNRALTEQSVNNNEGFVEYLQRSIPWYLKGNEPLGAAMAHTMIGQTLEREEPDRAIDQYRASLEIRRQAADSAGVASNLAGIGNVYDRIGKAGNAGQYYLEAAEISEKTGNTRLRAHTLASLGNLYERQGRDSDSRKYLKQSLALYKPSGSPAMLFSLNKSIGDSYFRQGLSDSARLNYEEALALSKNTSAGGQGMLQITYNLGVIAAKNHDTAAAQTYFGQALLFSEKMGDTSAERLSLAGLASLKPRKKPVSPPDYVLLALIRKTTSLSAKERLEAYHSLDAYLQTRGNPADAAHYSARYRMLRDSLFVDEMQAQLQVLGTVRESLVSDLRDTNALRVRYEHEHKQQKRLILISFLIVISLAAGLLVYRFAGKKGRQLQESGGTN